jgi:hypothetical protein
MMILSERAVAAENVMIAPEKEAATVTAGSASIHIARGACAFVANSGRDVAVFCLHDNATGDVTVTCGEHTIMLHAGQQVTITSSESLSFAHINPLPELAHRQITEHRLANGQRAFTSHFSLMSTLSKLQCLRTLNTAAAGRDRALHARILKNAAILQMVTGSRGPYKVSQATSAQWPQGQ